MKLRTVCPVALAVAIGMIVVRHERGEERLQLPATQEKTQTEGRSMQAPDAIGKPATIQSESQSSEVSGRSDQLGHPGEMTTPDDKDRVGMRLTKLLDDENAPIHERVQAAETLGQMKYVPAIPVLIRHVGLVDPDVVAISGNEDEPLVAARALASYGAIAVPQIVDAFLNAEEHDQTRVHLLLSAILGSRTEAAAKSYLDGLAAKSDKRVTERKLDTFKAYLPAPLQQR